MAKKQNEPARKPLSLPVLNILLALAEGARHGYAIKQDVEERSGGSIRLGPGTLYEAIQRLLDGGLIEESRTRGEDPANGQEAQRRYYALTDRGIARGLTGWQNGDFDYSGGIPDSADYMLLDKSYAANGGILSPALLSQRESQFGAEYVSALVASVPEPTCGLLIAVGGAAIAGRRRRT